jgi:hypothetical protein
MSFRCGHPSKRILEVIRRYDCSRARVCTIPSSVCLRSINGCQAGRTHSAVLDETRYRPNILLRPYTLRSSRRITHCPKRVIASVGATVDPAIAQRDFDSFSGSYRRYTGALLGKLNVDARRSGMFALEESLEVCRRCKCLCRKLRRCCLGRHGGCGVVEKSRSTRCGPP